MYVLELKQSTDKDEGFIEVKEAKANKQHSSIIGAFGAAAPTWEFEHINFVVGNCGSVGESNFYNELKSLMYKKERKIISLPIVCHWYAKCTVGSVGTTIQDPPGVRKMDTLDAFYLFVLYAVTCPNLVTSLLVVCHFEHLFLFLL